MTMMDLIVAEDESKRNFTRNQSKTVIHLNQWS